MNKIELEELIQEVMVEEGVGQIARDIALATVTGQLDDVIKDLGEDLYKQTIGKVLKKIDRAIDKKINAIVFAGVQLDTSFRELASFMIKGLGLNDEDMIGSFGFKKTSYESHFPKMKEGDSTNDPDTKVFNSTMSELKLTVPRLFNEAWVEELANPANYDVVKIAEHAVTDMKDILKKINPAGNKRDQILSSIPGAKPTDAMIYNKATINTLGRRLSVTTVLTEEGKHFNNILNDFYGQLLDSEDDLVELIAKATGMKPDKVKKKPADALQNLEKADLKNELDKEATEAKKAKAKAKAKASKKGTVEEDEDVDEELVDDNKASTEDQEEKPKSDSEGDSGTPKKDPAKEKAEKKAEKKAEEETEKVNAEVVSEIGKLVDRMEDTKRMIATAVAKSLLHNISNEKYVLASAFDMAIIANAYEKSKEGSKRKLAKEDPETSDSGNKDKSNDEKAAAEDE
jgi:hypothetical protein